MALSHVANQMQLHNAVKITDTLQGTVWRASMIANDSSSTTVVIKVVNQKQHNSSSNTINGKIYCDIQENIVSEHIILKYLTQQEGFPSSVVKFIDFFQLANELYLVMEDGGSSLFEFARESHKLIKSGYIELNHWKKVVRVIFKQMMQCIEYIHCHNVCHNDISLENFVINNIATYVDNKSGKLRFKIDDIRIKLCDFGLAELHKNRHCVSNKHCGKTRYKSMEIMNKQKYFCGKKNDIWSAGICLFMLSFGCYPWHAAVANDAVFVSRYVYISSGRIAEILIALGLLMYIDVDNVDLFQCIFKDEAHRISVQQMKQHKYLR